jgi:hypothetical protein
MKYKKYIKYMISIWLIFYIFKNIELKTFAKIFFTFDTLVIFIIWVLLNILNLFLSSYKLQVILKWVLKYKIIKFIDIVKIYFSSTFLWIFIPTNFWWDIPKVYFLKKKLNFKKSWKLINSIIIERVSWLLSLMIISILSLFVPKVLEIYKTILNKLNIFTIDNYYILLSIFLWIIILIIIWKILIKKIKLPKFEIKNKKKIFWLSLLFQFIMIINNFIVFYMITWVTDLIYFIVFVPLVIYIWILPISVQWIWIRDWLALIFFPLFISISSELILSYTIIMNMIVITTSIIGWIIYNFTKIKYENTKD